MLPVNYFYAIIMGILQQVQNVGFCLEILKRLQLLSIYLASFIEEDILVYLVIC